VKVELWNNNPAAVEATDRTIRALPGNGRLERDADDQVLFDQDGFANVIADDFGFLGFALRTQGYVKSVIQ